MTAEIALDWAICFSTDGELQGLAVRLPENAEFRLWEYYLDGDNLRLREIPNAGDDMVWVPLPRPLNYPSFLSFFARASLGVTNNLLDCLKPLATISHNRSVRQWLVLVLLRNFGVEFAVEPACTVCREIQINPNSIDAQEPLKEKPFEKIPLPSSFRVLPTESYRGKTRFFVKRLGARHVSAVEVLLQSFFPTGEFDEGDMESLKNEMTLALRADLLVEPIAAYNCTYSSADYWVVTQLREGGDETVEAFGGLLTFFGKTNEIWVAYLCGFGAVLTDVVARRAKELGFDRLLVWTTNYNQKAIKFYNDIGCQLIDNPAIRDHSINPNDCAAFSMALSKTQYKE